MLDGIPPSMTAPRVDLPGYADILPLSGEPSYIRLLITDTGRLRLEHVCNLNGKRRAVVQSMPMHHIVQPSPLSLQPSVHCPTCGLHGYVTDGQWAPI